MKKLTPQQEFYNATIDAKYGNDKSFAGYMKKENTAYPIGNCRIITIWKQEIKKDFRFGHGFTHTYEEAEKLANIARTSEDYFRKMNIDNIVRMIEKLDSDDYYFYLLPIYGEGIYTISIRHKLDGRIEGKDVYLLDDEQRAMARAAYRKELDKMNKRVDQYLKRYGLTKIRVWTYDQG